MPFIGTDQQIVGARDDGSPEGIVRIDAIGGDLVALSFTEFNCYTQLSGLGGGEIASMKHGSLAYNTSGDTTGLTMNGGTTAPSGTNASGSFAYAVVLFYGRTFGIRYRNDATPFTVSVDGSDAVRVVPAHNYLKVEAWDPQSAWSSNYEVSTVTHRDLPGGQFAPHAAKIFFSWGSAAGQNAVLLGGLVERNSNPQTPRRVSIMSAPVAVPTSSAAIQPNGASGSGCSQPFRYIDDLFYFNTTGSPITLYLLGYQYVSVPANSGVQVSPKNPMCSTFQTHYASATGLVMVALGGYF